MREAEYKDALIKDAKEKMAALEDPVQPDDAWTDVLKKMRKAGWDTRVPAPLVGGLPIGGANFVFLLPSGKRPKKGGEGGLDYLLNKDAAKKFAKEHFGWLGLSSNPHEKSSEKSAGTSKRNKIDPLVTTNRPESKIDTNAPAPKIRKIDSKRPTRKVIMSAIKRKSSPSHDDRSSTKSKRKKRKKEKSLRKFIPVGDYTLEETQRLLEEAAELVELKQKERDDAIAIARSLPFDVLESIYNEERLKKSTIDLTTNNAGPVEPDSSGQALRNMEKERTEFSARIAKVKKEKEEDAEDKDELLTQQTLATDIYQGRIDELGGHALAAGVDTKIVNEIRFRPLSSGR